MTTPRRGRRNISEHVRVLHNTLVNILSEKDRAYFIHSLNQYQKDRDVIELVTSLKSVLDSPRKREVYPLLREIIPSCDRRYFEKTWHTETRPQSLHSSRDWSLTRSRSPSRPIEPLQRSKFHSSLPGNLDKYDSGIDLSNLKNGSANFSRSSQKYPIRRIYMKRSQGMGFGFSMRGGSEHGVGLYVSSVDENSLAEYEGLLAGDHILSVNEVQFDGLAHTQAVKIIKNSKKLNLVVRSVGCIPNTFVAEETYKWIDPSGQRVSPPPNVDSNGRQMSIDGIHRSDLRLLGDDDERKVNIFVDDGDKLGLKIRGGAEYGLGIYIAGVDPNSAADKAGLKCGDQIMDVNGISFLNISHADAVKVLKSAKNMMFTMKDVGRLPFVRTTKDRTKWAKGKVPITLQSDTESAYTTAVQIHPTPDDNWKNTTTGSTCFERRPEDSKFSQGVVGSQLMYNGTGPSPKSLTEEQARQILTDSEFSTMAYYLEEYRKGFITVDSFVLALFSLLNTPAKVSLLTDIRGSIFPKDIDRFDELVLKKEIDAIKTRNMTVMDDAQSLHSAYSSSLSSYSGHSSSSRNSAKNSYGGIDSRPITPPRVPEVYLSRMPSADKTLTNDSSKDCFSSINDSQGLLPISSSSPRHPKQRMSSGESTTYIHTGDNTRDEITLNQSKTKDQRLTQNRSKDLETNGNLTEDSSCFNTLSSDFPEEALKKEKKGFSLFGHSKVKGSYSPNKQHKDLSALRQEISSLTKSNEIDVDKKVSIRNERQKNDKQSELTVNKQDGEMPKDVDLGNGISKEKTRKVLPSSDEKTSVGLAEDVDLGKGIYEREKTKPQTIPEVRTNDSNTETLLFPSNIDSILSSTNPQSTPEVNVQNAKHIHTTPTEKSPNDAHLAKISIGSKNSAFAPPKPPRTFSFDEGRKCEMNEYVEVKPIDANGINKVQISNEVKDANTSRTSSSFTEKNRDSNLKREAVVISATPPKPKPYHVYVKEQTESESSKLQVQKDTKMVHDNRNSNSISHELKDDSISQEKAEDEYVELEILPKSEPHQLDNESRTEEKTGPLYENHHITKQKRIHHTTIQDIFSDHFQPAGSFAENTEQQERSYDQERRAMMDLNGIKSSNKLSLNSNSKTADQRNGMFLAMEETVSSRSGLERKACWGEDDIESSDCNFLDTINEGLEDTANRTVSIKKINTDTFNISANSPKVVVESRDSQIQTQETESNETLENQSVSKKELNYHKDVFDNPKDLEVVKESSSHLIHPERTAKRKVNSDDNSSSTQPSSLRETQRKIANHLDEPSGAQSGPTYRPVVIVHEDKNKLTEKLPTHGSSVRDMIDIYNHMAVEKNPPSKDTAQHLNQKNANRKSWDGAHYSHPVSNGNNPTSSPQSKKSLKSNSDSNLMNLPKEQMKNIQVKIRASQELLDLRQAFQSKESTANSQDTLPCQRDQESPNCGPTTDGEFEIKPKVAIKRFKDGQYRWL